MENIVLENHNNRYLFLEILDKGRTSIVCKVKKEGTNEENKIVAKIIFPEYTNLNYHSNELKILSNLSIDNNSNKFIFRLQNSGEGIITKHGTSSNKKYQFLILDFAEKGKLYNYYVFILKPFTEKMAKIIFEKIIKSIQFCHNKGICNLDIKPENILLTEDYIPKLSSFGVAKKYKSEDNNFFKLRGKVSSAPYMPPEMIERTPYHGDAADIYSLGIVLMTLIYPYNFLFKSATSTDDLFKKFIDKNDINHEKFWKTIQKFDKNFPQISIELKNLFTKMISKDPKTRPKSDQILNDPWFDEIRNLNENEKNKLIFNEFNSREILIKEKKLKNNNIIVSHQNIDNYLDDPLCRSVSTEYFTGDVKIKKLKNGIFLKDFVKIKGELNPIKFMNNLFNMLTLKNNCEVDDNTKNDTLKFDMIFNKEEIKTENLKNSKKEDNEEFENEEDDDEGEELYKEKNKCCIQVKLYIDESDESDYVVRFVKKSGLLNDYYKNLEIIKSSIQKII